MVAVAAAVALTLLIALITGRLRQFLGFALQQLVEGSLYAASYQFLELPLDLLLRLAVQSIQTRFAVSFRMVSVATSFYQSFVNHFFLFPSFICEKYFIRPTKATISAICMHKIWVKHTISYLYSIFINRSYKNI